MLRACQFVCVSAGLLLVGCFVDLGTDTSAGETSSASTGTPTTTPTTGSDASTGETPGTTGVSATSETAETSTTASSTTCTSAGCDPSGDPAGCDVFAQDCPEDYKCSAYASNGGATLDAAKCVPITGSKDPGDSCIVEGSELSGLDDCDLGSRCTLVKATSNEGTCVATCGGSEAAPTCTVPGNVCTDGDGLDLCLTPCDPLKPACVDEALCVVVQGGFYCAPDAFGLQSEVFEPCEAANTCDPGLLCQLPKYASECQQDTTGCCLPVCDITGGNNQCPGVGQSCVSIFKQAMRPPPPGLENVGVCSL